MRIRLGGREHSEQRLEVPSSDETCDAALSRAGREQGRLPAPARVHP